MESAVHLSLHPNCHDQIKYTKFNLQVYHPPQYHGKVWHYNDSNTEPITQHGKPYFLFPEVLKRWSFQKNCAGIWSFLYYRERPCFFFPKIRSDTLDGQWKMIFLKKKYTEIWHFLQTFWKEGLFKKGRAGTWSFLYYLERWYFFPKNIFFPWAGSERWPFSRNTWKYDIFCVHVRALQTWCHTPLPKKIKDGLIPQKYT